MRIGNYKLGVRLGNGSVFVTLEDLVFGGGEYLIPVKEIIVDNGETRFVIEGELPVRLDKNIKDDWRKTWLETGWKEKIIDE